jgi:DNA-binding NarL/FixJ family response regulator
MFFFVILYFAAGKTEHIPGHFATRECSPTKNKREYITRQTRQNVRLSPEQQKIADLVGRGVNTVTAIAKELDIGEAATRTQIKRMIEKGCLEVVSSERPKKYRLKLR